MSLERDTDRRLRDWVTEGVDRAPERFVWAAIDEAERLPQRPAWRIAVGQVLARGSTARLAALAGALSVVGVLSLAVLAGLRTPTVGPGELFAPADLVEIVVWEDTKPRTWRLDNLVSNATDVSRIPIRSMSGAEIEALPDPAGLRAGRYTNFSGVVDGAFMSWSLVFETEAAAAAALPFYMNELSSPDAWGLGAPEAVGLGDEAYVYEGETTAFLGQPTGLDPHPASVYLWRHRNVLLALGGWFTFDPAEVRAAADGMDRRAEAALQR